MTNFEQLGLAEPVLRAIDELGYIMPTPIQEQAIPQLMEKPSDLLGLAQTGTGKTAAFGLPLISLVDLSQKHTQALILAPTRELCLQITNELLLFSKYTKGIRIEPVYGGASIVTQIKAVKAGVHIIVATPGRLRDLINRKAVNIENIDYVILDEADEMLNMGFKEELDEILQCTPENKSTWLFSATMPEEVSRIAREYMENPIEITVGNRNTGNADVDHRYVVIRPRDKYEALRRFLDLDPHAYGLVFTRTRKESQEVADALSRDGYSADALHGDLSQAQRDYVMDRFRTRRLQILVATDVAARGIDVQEISHVFHYNLPDDQSFYNHRAGRTGRAGSKGISIALASSKDMGYIRTLEKKLKVPIQVIDIPSGKEIAQHRLAYEANRLKELEISDDLKTLMPILEEALGELSREELMERILTLSFSKTLQGYLKNPDIATPKSASPRAESTSADRFSGAMTTIFINLGMTDVNGKADFINFICTEGDVSGNSIGRIKMFERHTFFDLDSSVAQEALELLSTAKFDGRKLRVDVDESRPAGGGGGGGYKDRSADRGGNRKGGFDKKGGYGNKGKTEGKSFGGGSKAPRKRKAFFAS